MSEIRQWLETTELGQYADAFEANDIDMDLLRHSEGPWHDERWASTAHPERDPVSFATSRCDAWARPLF